MIKEKDFPEIKEPIGVLGYGVEGASTVQYLLAQGFKDITVFDRKAPAHLDPQVRYFENGSGHYLEGIPAMRTLFRSAGVRPDLKEIEEFLRRGGTLTSQTGLAFALAGRERIIGVTGTLGKGTCCSILHAILTEAGIPASLGGNIGIPALDLAAHLPQGEKLILELSSFQLSSLAQSPFAAAVLKTTSEHLDWHLNQQEYWQHKSHLVSHQTVDDIVTYHADTLGSAWIASQSPARKLPFGQSTAVKIVGETLTWTKWDFSISLADTRLSGKFNLENLAAAGTLALELGASPQHIQTAAAHFAGLEHRLEFIRELRGVSFFNDSYATRPDATIGAIHAFSGIPTGLILGGSDKFADFSELAKTIASASHIRSIALIGQTADRLESELKSVGLPKHGHPAIKQLESLEKAVEYLLSHLSPSSPLSHSTHLGPVEKRALLLSPACASFGMFENYKERGKAFKRLVAGL